MANSKISNIPNNGCERKYNLIFEFGKRNRIQHFLQDVERFRDVYGDDTLNEMLDWIKHDQSESYSEKISENYDLILEAVQKESL